MPPHEHPPILREPPQGIAHHADPDLHWLMTSDGVALRVAHWPAATQHPLGTVLLLQGRSEFIEKYTEVTRELCERGFAVVTFDWRGQGGSSRQLRNPMKGHVEDFDDYLHDLDIVTADMLARALPRPWSILAHSMGGGIALLALARGPSPFERAILSSPLVAIAGMAGSRFARFAVRISASLGFTQLYIPSGSRKSRVAGAFDANPFTGDPQRYANMQAWLTRHPDIVIGDPTIGWVSAAFNALDAFSDEAFGQLSRTPVLMLNAGADTIVSPQAAAALAQRMRGASAIEFLGARHEILMERDETRALFWRAFDAFVAKAENRETAPTT